MNEKIIKMIEEYGEERDFLEGLQRKIFVMLKKCLA